MHFWEKVRRDLKSWERENFKNTQTFYYWPRNNWENQILPRSELQTPGRPVWPASASRAELRCQTNNFFAKQLICSQRILATRQYNKRSQYMPAFFGDSRLRFFSLLIGCKCSGLCTIWPLFSQCALLYNFCLLSPSNVPSQLWGLFKSHLRPFTWPCLLIGVLPSLAFATNEGGMIFEQTLQDLLSPTQLPAAVVGAGQFYWDHHGGLSK